MVTRENGVTPPFGIYDLRSILLPRATGCQPQGRMTCRMTCRVASARVASRPCGVRIVHYLRSLALLSRYAHSLSIPRTACVRLKILRSNDGSGESRLARLRPILISAPWSSGNGAGLAVGPRNLRGVH